MNFELTLLNSNLIQKPAVNALMACNDRTAQYGLSLTEQQATALVQTRTHSLSQTGRIEFGGGIIDKLIMKFCTSPYLYHQNYEQTLHELIEVFYHFKNETLDLVSDDNLIAYMKQSFDGVCQGSIDLLSGRELEHLAHNIRYGRAPDHTETGPEAEEEEDEQY